MRALRALALPILALAAVWAVSQGGSQDVSKLESDLKRIQDKRDSASRKLRDTRKQVNTVRTDIRQIDSELGELENSIALTAERLETAQVEQVQTAEELEVVTHKLQERREQVRNRLRWMYMSGDSHVAEVLLGAKDMGEFASRSYLLERIAKADKELFDAFKDLREQVRAKKLAQDKLVARIGALRRQQDFQQHSLKSTRDQKQRAFAQLRGVQRDLERLIAQLDADERAIEARIEAYHRGAGKESQSKPFSGKLARPVPGGMTSGFGMRHHPILKRSRMHNGVDFGGKSGDPIRAAADGVVISATYMSGYGNCVILDHGGGVSTLYAHASRLNVREGQSVKQGQTIAAIGATGLATGPHLHFEVRVNGKPVNPVGWL